MDRTTICVPGLILLLVSCLLIAGCSTSDSTTDAVPSVSSNAKAYYSEGDIVRNPSATSDTAWLVLGYDPASDTYERALINRNADGSWGYRVDNRTEKAGRAVMEKVYSEVVANRLPSSIPVVTPAIITTAPTITWAPPSVAAVTTTASTAPTIMKIIPDYGDAGTTVQVTDLVGTNLKNNATVTLRRAGSVEIQATGVRAVTPTSITCTLAIPASAAAGSWDVVVTNPDGQSATYTNIFLVHRTISSSITTPATSAGTLPITFIDPPVGHVGTNQISVTGGSFQNGASVILQKNGKPDITARDTRWSSNATLTCYIDIPSGSFGNWDFKVLNPDGTYGINYGAFTIN
jgi:hypothetical protein